MLLAWLLRKIISHGHLELIDANGKRHGIASGAGPKAVVRLHDRALHHKLIFNPSLHVGEAYVDGTLTLDEGTLYDLLEIMLVSQMTIDEGAWGDFERAFKRFIYRREIVNRIGRAERNVKHHYDLSAELYRLFLDSDEQYSCAYFLTPDDDIEMAQLQKKQHIAAKLLLKPGQKVLDIGCGWGGLALYLASRFDVHVTGLTLSREQYEVACQRARAAGLDKRVEFKLLDYRQETGVFDRIVSVGMFEHVGDPHYKEFFTKTGDLLADDGVFLLHTIGRMTPPTSINVWVRRNIFPGAYVPSLSQLVPIMERNRIWLDDFENLRLHYAETLKAWNERFQKNRTKVVEIYDERFCRLWEFYLQCCEGGFRYQDLTVFQLLLSKTRRAVPLTRDFIFEEEQRLREADAHAHAPTSMAGE